MIKILSPLLPTESLLFSTLRLEVTYRSGRRATGTAFFASFNEHGENHSPALVTNKHIVGSPDKNNSGSAERVRLRFHTSKNDSPDIGRFYDVEIGSPLATDIWKHHPDPCVDLCAMPFAFIAQKAFNEGYKLYVSSVAKTSMLSDYQYANELDAAEDLLMVGYPNGLWDKTNNLPLIRYGVTATHPGFDYNSRTEFVIDAACFPGSSGSPVFLYNKHGISRREGAVIGPSRLAFLGVLYAGPIFVAEGKIVRREIPTSSVHAAETELMMNLGYVIHAKRVFELEALF